MEKTLIEVSLPKETATVKRSLVIRYIPSDINPYVVHYKYNANTDKPFYEKGDYNPTLEEALVEFQERLQQSLNRNIHKIEAYDIMRGKMFTIRREIDKLNTLTKETLIEAKIIQKNS